MKARAVALSLITFAVACFAAGCATTAQWEASYIPPVQINGHYLGDSIESLVKAPAPIEDADASADDKPPTTSGPLLLGGDDVTPPPQKSGPQYFQLSSYVVPGEQSKYPERCRVRTHYLHCAIGADPGQCGWTFTYVSEEVNALLRQPVPAQTCHNIIIADLIKEHGPPQDKQAQTSIITPEGEVIRSAMPGEERRVWCRLVNGQVPCKSMMVATFNNIFGRGSVTVTDKKVTTFTAAFERWHHFEHPLYVTMSGEYRLVSEEEIERREREFEPLDTDDLLTEKRLNAEAATRGVKREKPVRGMPEAQFYRQLLMARSRAHERYAPSVVQTYWNGYTLGLAAMFMPDTFGGDDTAWLQAMQSGQVSMGTYALQGYLHGLRGKPNPPILSGGRCVEFDGLQRIACRLFEGKNHDVIKQRAATREWIERNFSNVPRSN